MTAIRRITDATAEPITFSEFVSYTRITSAAGDDTIFNTLVSLVRQDAEKYCNRSFMYQCWGYYPDYWPSEDYFELPYATPLSSVASVIYTKSDATTATFSTDYYDVDTDSEPGRIVLEYEESWPTEYELASVRPIIITYYTGVATASSVPAGIRQAVMMQTAELWQNREVMGTLIRGAPEMWENEAYTRSPFLRIRPFERLLEPFRIWYFG